MLGKGEARTHVSHCVNRATKHPFPFAGVNIRLLLNQREQLFVLLLTFKLIVQPCSEGGRDGERGKHQAVDYLSLIISNVSLGVNPERQMLDTVVYLLTGTE